MFTPHNNLKAVIIFTLHIGKLRHGEAMYFGKVYTSSNWESKDSNPDSVTPNFYVFSIMSMFIKLWYTKIV